MVEDRLSAIVRLPLLSKPQGHTSACPLGTAQMVCAPRTPVLEAAEGEPQGGGHVGGG